MMESLMELFGASSISETLYWLVAAGSSGVLLLKVLLGFFGADFDHDFDFELGGEEVSLSALMSFVCMGGWTGALSHRMTELPEIGILLLALFVGTLGFAGSIVLMNRLKGLEESGNVLMENALGKVGQVYLGIPGERQGTGQVQIVIQGRFLTLDAMTEGVRIATGQKVLVYGTEGNCLLVEPADEMLLTE